MWCDRVSSFTTCSGQAHQQPCGELHVEDWDVSRLWLQKRELAIKIRGDMRLAEQKPIAVVDDDPEILESLELLLSCHGYETKLFLSGEEFLCVVQTLEAA